MYGAYVGTCEQALIQFPSPFHCAPVKFILVIGKGGACISLSLVKAVGVLLLFDK